jgi:D-alanine transaminase
VREEELRAAEEVFLTGTTTDVMPIVRLDGMPVRDGRPGPIASELRDALAALMADQAVGSG